MNIIIPLYLSAAALLTASAAEIKYNRVDFPNLINIVKGNDIQPQGYFFSDLGNWHGYGLNQTEDLPMAGGFRGPAFNIGRKSGLQWLSDCFEKLTLTDTLGNPLPYSQIISTQYLPGCLVQTLKAGNWEVTLQAMAVSDKSTMTLYTLTNASSREQSCKTAFSGALLPDGATLALESDNLHVSLDNNRHHFFFSLPHELGITHQSKKEYRAESKSITLQSGKSITLCSFCTFIPFTDKEATLSRHNALKKTQPEQYRKQNEDRWNGYLDKLLTRKTPYMQEDRNRKWAIKALMTMNTNWRSSAGDLKHGGLVPGTGHFDAFWAWDSWEHAAAAALYEPDLAKDQMRAMFDYQTPEGMIPDVISVNKQENGITCSKPPIAGWATYMVYQRTGDIEFVREMLPKLLKYHQWRYKYRDHDQNGLCEYGGTQPQVYLGQWESGMDVAVKFDGVKMLENVPGAYSMDQESIDLNSYLCAEKFYLAALAEVTGDKETASSLREEGVKLRKLIQDKFFDKETGYFYDRKLGTGELIKIIDISGWIPLLTNVATPEQAAGVRKNMLDPELFGTYFPFSSLNHKHPLYNPGNGYFRGQTWMNYTYFGIRGFKNYGYAGDARKYTTLLPDRLKGIADPGIPIRENYHSATGEGMTAMHFGWSSAFSLLLLTEDEDTFPYVPMEKQ